MLSLFKEEWEGPYQLGDWIVRQSFPGIPCQVVKCFPFPCLGGYLVEHDGAGIPCLSVDQVSICPDLIKPKTLKKEQVLKPIKNKLKKVQEPQGEGLFGMME
jgi:hypothetical protein